MEKTPKGLKQSDDNTKKLKYFDGNTYGKATHAPSMKVTHEVWVLGRAIGRIPCEAWWSRKSTP